MTALGFALLCGVFGIVYGVWSVRWILAQPQGNERMREIAAAIQQGASAYLNRQYTTISMAGGVLFLALGFALNWYTAFGFLIGAVLSGAAGYIGMNISVRANLRTAEAAKNGLNAALQIAFRGGAITGMLVVGLGLIGVAGYYTILLQLGLSTDHALHALVGLAFGSSLISIFARLGGGIFTKGADVGADLVGKVEAGIPEDDPRNPATIADNVGDNVGDCAGMAADVFESYALTIVAAMILGGALFGLKGVVFPLLARSGAIWTSILGSFFVKAKDDNEDPINPLIRGFIISAVAAVVIFMGLAVFLPNDPKAGYAAVTGIVSMLALLYLTKYYTGPGEKPVVEISKASQTGAGTNLISGLSIGMESTFYSVIIIVVTILAGYSFLGFYGISLAGMGMLATAGIIMALDTFGPISDNAQGLVEMAGLKGKAEKVTAGLDAVGNTTKALTKGFAVGFAAVAASSLFATYFVATGLTSIDIAQPK